MAHVDASDSAPEEAGPTIHTIGLYRNKAKNGWPPRLRGAQARLRELRGGGAVSLAAGVNAAST